MTGGNAVLVRQVDWESPSLCCFSKVFLNILKSRLVGKRGEKVYCLLGIPFYGQFGRRGTYFRGVIVDSSRGGFLDQNIILVMVAR